MYEKSTVKLNFKNGLNRKMTLVDMERYNEIQLTKNKMDLNNRKMPNHPPAPGRY